MSHLAQQQHDWLQCFKHAGPLTKREQTAIPTIEQPERFEVYHNSIKAFHLQALELAFPTVQRIVGEAYFKQLARHYFQQQQLQAPSLTLYGAHFSSVLAELLPDRKELADYPYLADCAALEWQRHLSYYAADFSIQSAEQTAELLSQSHETLYFKLAPSLALLKIQWPLLQLFNDTTEPSPYILIYREHFLVRQRYATHAEAALFQAIEQKRSFADFETHSGEALQLLPHWMQQHWCRLVVG